MISAAVMIVMMIMIWLDFKFIGQGLLTKVITCSVLVLLCLIVFPCGVNLNFSNSMHIEWRTVIKNEVIVDLTAGSVEMNKALPKVGYHVSWNYRSCNQNIQCM